MSSGHAHDVVAELAVLDAAISSLGAGAPKDAVRDSFERFLAIVSHEAQVFGPLRRGNELPASFS